jgi:hypothetical protein
MTHRTRPHRFSDETRQLDAEKSGLLFYARERAAANDPIEAARTFAKAARMEEDIATRVEAEGYPADAMIAWISTASCYLMAHDYAQALRVCEVVAEKPYAERYQDILQEIKADCEKAIVNPFRTIGAGEPPPDSLYPKPVL